MTGIILPGGLIQHSFHLVYLISTEVDNSEVNPAVLVDAHFSEPKAQTSRHLFMSCTSVSRCVFIHFQAVPEVVHELSECVRPLGERYNDIDHDARVHGLALDLHHRTERSEEHELREVLWAVAFEHEVIEASSVQLCPSQACGREENVTTSML